MIIIDVCLNTMYINDIVLKQVKKMSLSLLLLFPLFKRCKTLEATQFEHYFETGGFICRCLSLNELANQIVQKTNLLKHVNIMIQMRVFC